MRCLQHHSAAHHIAHPATAGSADIALVVPGRVVVHSVAGRCEQESKSLCSALTVPMQVCRSSSSADTATAGASSTYSEFVLGSMVGAVPAEAAMDVAVVVDCMSGPAAAAAAEAVSYMSDPVAAGTPEADCVVGSFGNSVGVEAVRQLPAFLPALKLSSY